MAGLNSANEDEGPLASINIIPFVDIILVVLVIFMLTATAIARASLEVRLPRAASAGAHVASTVNLVITKGGELLLNGERTSREDAAAFVRKEAAADPKAQAVISADKGVEYGKVIELIDLVKTNGITAFALDVERGPAPVRP